jgi:hypothetical protein
VVPPELEEPPVEAPPVEPELPEEPPVEELEDAPDVPAEAVPLLEPPVVDFPPVVASPPVVLLPPVVASPPVVVPPLEAPLPVVPALLPEEVDPLEPLPLEPPLLVPALAPVVPAVDVSAVLLLQAAPRIQIAEAKSKLPSFIGFLMVKRSFAHDGATNHPAVIE